MAAEQVDSTSVASRLKDLSEDGKNSTKIRCQRCPSVVLNPNVSNYKQKEIFLPFMHKKNDKQKPEDGETLTDHWVVNDMFMFENVGFSNTVGTIKYLICADCEIGPIGFHDTQTKNEFYIALDRVKHDE